jgi:hypothetical protein
MRELENAATATNPGDGMKRFILSIFILSWSATSLAQNYTSLGALELELKTDHPGLQRLNQHIAQRFPGASTVSEVQLLGVLADQLGNATGLDIGFKFQLEGTGLLFCSALLRRLSNEYQVSEFACEM